MSIRAKKAEKRIRPYIPIQKKKDKVSGCWRIGKLTDTPMQMDGFDKLHT